MLLASGQPEVKETERFVRIMNHFFDMFNVHCTTEGIAKKNNDLLPYRSLTDPRFKVNTLLRMFGITCH